MTSGRAPRNVGSPGGPSPAVIAFIVGTAFVLGVPSLVALGVGVWVIASQDDHHWQRYAVGAGSTTLAAIALVWRAVGNPIAFHYSGYLGWWDHPSPSFTAWLEASRPAVPIGLPAGFLLGALVIGVGQASALGAEWHPLEVRRLAVDSKRLSKRVQAAMVDVVAQHACSLTADMETSP